MIQNKQIRKAIGFRQWRSFGANAGGEYSGFTCTSTKVIIHLPLEKETPSSEEVHGTLIFSLEDRWGYSYSGSSEHQSVTAQIEGEELIRYLDMDAIEKVQSPIVKLFFLERKSAGRVCVLEIEENVTEAEVERTFTAPEVTWKRLAELLRCPPERQSKEFISEILSLGRLSEHN